MNQVSKRLRQICQGITRRSMSMAASSALTGDNIGYVEIMYEAWREDPKSVHLSWNDYFRTTMTGTQEMGSAQPIGVVSAKDITDHLKVLQLITAFQLKGHVVADLDPLCKWERES